MVAPWRLCEDCGDARLHVRQISMMGMLVVKLESGGRIRSGVAEDQSAGKWTDHGIQTGRDRLRITLLNSPYFLPYLSRLSTMLLRKVKADQLAERSKVCLLDSKSLASDYTGAPRKGQGEATSFLT